MPPDVRDYYLYDLKLAGDTAKKARVGTTVAARDKTFQLWEDFARAHNFSPDLSGVYDPIVPLQVFAVRYRRSEFFPRNMPV